MGLDSVELVMSVEEHFGITIPDDDASTLTTVGNLLGFERTHRCRWRPDRLLSANTGRSVGLNARREAAVPGRRP